MALVAGLAVWAGWGLGLFLAKRVAREDFWKFLKTGGGFLATAVAALILVSILGLTRFNLGDRVLSIVSQEHIVTMAEKDGEKRKIDLEEIEKYQALGFQVFEEKASDVNVESRLAAYASNWQMVKEHWLLGQGQGSVLMRREFVHNANNIFWEWWIAAGLGGLAAFILLLAALVKEPLALLKKKKGALDNSQLAWSALVLMALTVIVVTNFFNAGILFGPLWVVLGILGGRRKNS